MKHVKIKACLMIGLLLFTNFAFSKERESTVSVGKEKLTVTEKNKDLLLQDKKISLSGQVVDINNGARLETYAIPGPRGSGVICLNGAAARLVQPGDKVIIITYVMLDEREAKEWKPRVAFLDDANRIMEMKNEEKHGEIK